MFYNLNPRNKIGNRLFAFVFFVIISAESTQCETVKDFKTIEASSGIGGKLEPYPLSIRSFHYYFAVAEFRLSQSLIFEKFLHYDHDIMELTLTMTKIL